jgi:DNA-binding response OmpR family regulator
MTSKRLLAIDDEVDFGAFLRKAAEKLGFEVRFTTHADEFKALYRSFVPTVITLDIVMPWLDGIELIQWLAAEDCTARVVIISGFDPRYSEAAEIIGGTKGRMAITRLNKPASLAEIGQALL